MSESRYRLLARLSGITAALSGLLTIITIINTMWIESIFEGAEPDGGSGELEWLIAVGFGVVAVVAGLVCLWARRAATAHALS